MWGFENRGNRWNEGFTGSERITDGDSNGNGDGDGDGDGSLLLRASDGGGEGIIVRVLSMAAFGCASISFFFFNGKQSLFNPEVSFDYVFYGKLLFAIRFYFYALFPFF